MLLCTLLIIYHIVTIVRAKDGSENLLLVEPLAFYSAHLVVYVVLVVRNNSAWAMVVKSFASTGARPNE